MISYCIECDAEPDQCEHDGPRYLDAVRYKLIAGEKPKGWIWQPSPDDSARMKAGSGYMNRPTTPVRRTAVPLDDLLVMVDEAIGLEDNLELLVSLKYLTEPLKVSRLVEKACTSTSLKSPGGYLVSRLREL